MSERNQEQEPGSPEQQPRDVPRIYAASLADYNAGRLHGEWIDANQEVEELQERIAAMLERSPQNRLCVWCGQEATEHPRGDERGVHSFASGKAEEYAIHDYEGFSKLRLSEYEDLETVSALGKGIAEHGLAFAAWASVLDRSDPEQLDRFQYAYLGEWDSVDAYAEQLLDDVGVTDELDKISESIRPYVSIDIAGFARDLVLGGDITAVDDGEHTYIFDGRL